MYPTQLHSYLLWRSSVNPDAQRLVNWRYTAAVSLIPAMMVGIFVFGWWAAWVLFLSVASALITDVLVHRFLYPDSPGTRDGTWILTGLLLGLLLPPNVPWIFPIVGASAAVFLGKHYLSVDGMPWLQPAAVGLLLLNLLGFGFWSSNPMLGLKDGQPHWPVLTREIEPSIEGRSKPEAVMKLLRDFFGGDNRKSVTPLTYQQSMTDRGEPPTLPDGSVAEAKHKARPIDLVKSLPATPFHRVTIPGDSHRYETADMLQGYVPATIGGSSVLAIGFGVLLLLFAGAVSPVIPVMALATMFAVLHFLAWLYGGVPDARVIAPNIVVHLLTGSTVLAIFYLAASPTTAARSFMGKLYMGVAFGVLEVLLRIFLPLPEALFLSVIIIQACAFFIDQWLAPPREENRATNGTTISSSTVGRL
ncbi:MAG TPA: RnfABCDGE type electron transport complex subunit D [Planctomycetota bacterium]|jgi:Na+-translocating ferredoxin:NAD+ oxidoreductase RnfD subunit